MPRGRPALDPERQLARAHTILDAAAELILRWGYDKTTIDDVARRAEVAKGTIYLHWKTRDALFAALLRRERVLMLAEARERAPRSPRALFGELSLGMLRRPLLKALLIGDTRVLGKLTRRKDRAPGALELGGAFEAYLAELVALGAVRPVAPGEHALVISSVVYGFLLLPGLLPGGSPVPDERLAELVADTVERALATGEPLPAGRAAAVARATSGYLDAIDEIARRKLAASMGVESTVIEERVT
ncbi:TetR/AcrR family transcriptional regulator [Nonomuraea sp. NN258]|uniref:TetR/AcrR family transcriptional regulator n=1 Tax=Nonomuraea antri TaxID=2730852 RepID=UPI001569551F|nr:TetR/AcrR family transcriptional regulator [Nonomuraea antri]NRQ32854.1 TetR/AcrR family transcriptional regulator [Nonomuraea antri]